MVSLASMATLADGNVMAVAKTDVFGIINFCCYIKLRKEASRNAFLTKKKLLKASSIKTLIGRKL